MGRAIHEWQLLVAAWLSWLWAHGCCPVDAYAHVLFAVVDGKFASLTARTGCRLVVLAGDVPSTALSSHLPPRFYYATLLMIFLGRSRDRALS